MNSETIQLFGQQVELLDENKNRVKAQCRIIKYFMRVCRVLKFYAVFLIERKCFFTLKANNSYFY